VSADEIVSKIEINFSGALEYFQERGEHLDRVSKAA